MPNPWFRFYSETLRDRKLERIIRITGQPKATIIGIWATLLALANDSPEYGALLLTDSMPLTFDDFCLETGLDSNTLRPILDQFIALKMLSLRDGVYYATNWNKRQFKSDSSRERVQQHRVRKKEEVQPPSNDKAIVDGNDDVTLQDSYSNAPDTDTDTDTDTEREGAANAASPPPETPPPKSKNSKKRQKKPVPAAVTVFQQNAHRFPAKSWYADVAQTVGDAETDLAFWGKVVKAYVGQGWNPTNVKNMLEFYGRREVPGDGVSGGSATRSTYRTADEYPEGDEVLL